MHHGRNHYNAGLCAHQWNKPFQLVPSQYICQHLHTIITGYLFIRMICDIYIYIYRLPWSDHTRIGWHQVASWRRIPWRTYQTTIWERGYLWPQECVCRTCSLRSPWLLPLFGSLAAALSSLIPHLLLWPIEHWLLGIASRNAACSHDSCFVRLTYIDTSFARLCSLFSIKVGLTLCWSTFLNANRCVDSIVIAPATLDSILSFHWHTESVPSLLHRAKTYEGTWERSW